MVVTLASWIYVPHHVPLQVRTSAEEWAKPNPEDGSDAAFGEDEFYQKIVQDDIRGDFEKQRDAWREGTDFSFTVEFPAKKPDDADTSGNGGSDGVVDAQVVEEE